MSEVRKLDLFKTLGNVDKKNVDYYKKLSTEEQSGFVPFVLMRWLTGTSSSSQIVAINEFVNPYVFSLTHDKDLSWKLLVAAADGKSRRYQWNKPPSKRETGKSNTVALLVKHLGYTTSQAIDVLPLLSQAAIMEMADAEGLQADDVSKIKKELKQDAKNAAAKNASTILGD